MFSHVHLCFPSRSIKAKVPLVVPAATTVLSGEQRSAATLPSSCVLPLSRPSLEWSQSTSPQLDPPINDWLSGAQTSRQQTFWTIGNRFA